MYKMETIRQSYARFVLRLSLFLKQFHFWFCDVCGLRSILLAEMIANQVACCLQSWTFWSPSGSGCETWALRGGCRNMKYRGAKRWLLTLIQMTSLTFYQIEIMRFLFSWLLSMIVFFLFVAPYIQPQYWSSSLTYLDKDVLTEDFGVPVFTDIRPAGNPKDFVCLHFELRFWILMKHMGIWMDMTFICLYGLENPGSPFASKGPHKLSPVSQQASLVDRYGPGYVIATLGPPESDIVISCHDIMSSVNVICNEY